MTDASLTSSIALRRMEPRDIDAVHAIDNLSFGTPWPRRSYRFELTENPAGHLWVAEIEAEGDARKIVGFIALWLIEDEAHIGTLAVHPDYRQRGFARRLLARALEESGRMGARTATLEVRRSNYPAQALYRQFGFEVAGQRPAYYHDNHEDALLMTVQDLHRISLDRFQREGARP